MSIINVCLLCPIFSSRTPEQARIGIPTLGESVDSLTHPPAIVIYMVDPFLCSSGAGDGGGGCPEDEGAEVEPGSIWLLGLLRCYTEMLKLLPETIRPALVLQVHTGYSLVHQRPFAPSWYYRYKLVYLLVHQRRDNRPTLVQQIQTGLFTGSSETIRPALMLQIQTGLLTASSETIC